jgi:hypothetical protein
VDEEPDESIDEVLPTLGHPLQASIDQVSVECGKNHEKRRRAVGRGAAPKDTFEGRGGDFSANKTRALS